MAYVWDIGLAKGLVRVWDDIEVHARFANDFRVGLDWFMSQAKGLHPWGEQPSFSSAYGCWEADGSGEADECKLVRFVPAIGGA